MTTKEREERIRYLSAMATKQALPNGLIPLKKAAEFASTSARRLSASDTPKYGGRGSGVFYFPEDIAKFMVSGVM
jgi:hypothetical protein